MDRASRVGDDGRRVFPARAGMDRIGSFASAGPMCVPRPRGDGPATNGASAPAPVFPARAGMDRSSSSPSQDARPVFPARAGMDRRRIAPGSRKPCSPPARGWTGKRLRSRLSATCSPPARGWTGWTQGRAPPRMGVPRPRGDGPVAQQAKLGHLECSPPARGWTGGSSRIPGDQCVPRPRGDGPDETVIAAVDTIPRPRGDGPLTGRDGRTKVVFGAGIRQPSSRRAGMDR